MGVYLDLGACEKHLKSRRLQMQKDDRQEASDQNIHAIRIYGQDVLAGYMLIQILSLMDYFSKSMT